MSQFPEYVSVEYTDGEGEDPEDYPSLEAKFQKATEVVRQGLEEYENPAVMWTGGKDSTLTLYVVREVAREFGYDVPPVVFIDHFQHFDELLEFVERWATNWDLEVVYARNEDVGDYVEANDLDPGDDIPVEALSEHNQHHVREILEYEEDTFPFLLDTYVGNHLLKTVALNDAIEEGGFDAIISGVRWDEQEARADETFFSPRHDPDI
ncbi:MAG: phosphoadenosine phosphosulfate reductase family protein, partial [Halobacteriaceae archaeon]